MPKSPPGKPPRKGSKTDITTVRKGIGRHFYSGGGIAQRQVHGKDGGHGRSVRPTAVLPVASWRQNRISTDPIPKLAELQEGARKNKLQISTLDQLYRASIPADALEAETQRLIALEGAEPSVAETMARRRLSGLGIKLPAEAAERPRQQPRPQPRPKQRRPGSRQRP
ncbi:MAG: hypothetical protein NT067_06975 [Candidatus Diapherotrites archaeon]|nr:hypothetical protein [Candidatus Diapherotrites archaeon]